MSIKLNKDWDVPTGLSREARKLAFDIRKVAFAFHWDAGGQKVFWSPQQWQERGEPFGKGAELVILHESGDHARYFSLDHAYEGSHAIIDYERDRRQPIYDNYEFMIRFLKKRNFWSEAMYRWSSAIYKNENS